MKTDFIKSNPELDALIADAKTPQELRAVMLQNLSDRGAIKIQDDQLAAIGREARIPEPSRPPSFPVSDAAPTCMRVFYPHANDRYEIYGSSDDDLDKKEAAIRAMYR
jgi:hypothetical protein